MKKKLISEKIESDTKELEKLNKENSTLKTPLYSMSPYEILVNLKNIWFDILDDLHEGNISFNILLKDDRLFYVGLSLILFALLLYSTYVLLDFDESEKNNAQIIEKHYYHNQITKNEK